MRSIINVADGATANSADAVLLARANHTGTQAAGTITGLAGVATSGSALWTSFSSLAIQLSRTAASYSISASASRPAAMAAAMDSAASMPLFIAVWLPLMRGTLTKPAEQPISTPPGKVSFGIDCQPPSVIARAPYDTRVPPCRCLITSGWCLKRWNSSNGDSHGFL